ncbi:MAG: EI24 domain-containing protein [Flavobacteriales bacterium]|nr:EI24 domain-containing protein [Flavobacteriales bacterium]MCB9447610.1 EI24 domain-containing protein [Flavobacteriales bacterium]
MSFTTQVLLGFRSYAEAHQFIRNHRLWGYLLVPGIINLILFAVFAWTAWQWSAAMLDTFWAWANLDSWGWAGWLKGSLVFLTGFVLRAALLMIYLSIYKYMVLILLSPLLALLSEKCDEILTERSYPFSMSRLMSDAWRGALLAIRNLLVEALITLALYLGGMIPFVGMAAPVLLLLTEAYFYGFSMIDYSLERKRLNRKESIDYVRRYRPLAIANGLGFHALYLIPVVGWMIAPTYSVVAATLAIHQIPNSDGKT